MIDLRETDLAMLEGLATFGEVGGLSGDGVCRLLPLLARRAVAVSVIPTAIPCYRVKISDEGRRLLGGIGRSSSVTLDPEPALTLSDKGVKKRGK